MRPALTLISVRVNNETLQLIHQLSKQPRPLNLHGTDRRQPKRLSRSAIIRHAITAGLDVLTDSEPIKL